MDVDLISRATKYARGAGRIGLGHYQAAQRTERDSRYLGWLSALLSAAAGTSVLAKQGDFIQQLHPRCYQLASIAVGLAAILAAVFAAIERTSKLAERVEAHRKAGAKYGRLRRHLDMLGLRLRGGDIGRVEALAKLDELGDKLSALASRSPSLSDKIFETALRSFDNQHPEYKNEKNPG